MTQVALLENIQLSPHTMFDLEEKHTTTIDKQ